MRCNRKAEANDICCITAAMESGTGLKEFHKEFPNRFFDVGICEQHAVTFASSLALSGLKPIVCIYSTFLQRAFDQILHEVALQNSHVVFMVDRAGLVGDDGETHHGEFDIAYLNMIPNMTILSPINDKDLEEMIEYAIYKIDGPVAIRYPRGEAVTNIDFNIESIKFNKAVVIDESKNDLVVLSIGDYISKIHNIYNELKINNKDFNLVNLRFIKPFDKELINDLCKKFNNFYFIEEGIYSGSLTQEIESYISINYKNKNLYHTVIDDIFIEQGDINSLHKKYQFDYDSIKNNIIKIQK